MVTFIARYWRVVAIALAVAALLAWASHRYNAALERADRQGYERSMAEMAEQVRLANEATAAAEASARKRVQEVDRDHQKAIADLDARYASRPVPVLRLRAPAASCSEVPRDPAAASIDSGTASTDGLPGGIPKDLGPDVERRILRPADDQAQRLIACQAYVLSLNTLR
jgi:hypothetical protein